ncbi:MAG TPA: glycosyltransferase, partial [Gemmatimonadales bacterium]
AGVPASRVHYIQNGWVPSAPPLSRAEARTDLGLAPQDLVVGWVARLIPVKSCDVFLRAIAACRGLPVKAAIVGEGPERARLESLASELGIDQQVRFCGARPEAGRFFSAFDLFVLSSRSEGTPMTLLEAMAAEVPIVATAVGGVPHVVTPAEALLVPSEDPASLGAAIRECVGNPAAARTRAAAATRRLATDFSAERWLASHEALYRSLRR